MQVKIIPIVIRAFGTVTKGLLKALEDLEVGGRVETIQTTVIENGQNSKKSPRDLRRFEWQLNLQWKTLNLRWCEKL